MNPITPAASTAPAFSFGAAPKPGTAATAAAAPSGGFQFGGNLNFGGAQQTANATPTAPAQAPVPNLSFSTPSLPSAAAIGSTPSALGIPNAGATTTQSNTLGATFGAAPVSGVPISIAPVRTIAAPVATIPTPALAPANNNLVPSNPAATGFSMTQTAAAAAQTTTTTGIPAAQPPPFDANKSTALASLTTTTTTTASSVVTNTTQLNFCQLEEYNNKWIVKLEDQEKMFINHATEINSWDKILNINNNKIIELSEAVEKVKIEQQTLEKELEVIAAHHAELDECITPLQKELSKLPHSDYEKAQTYILAESLDTQLRQMSKDLKEVIEHLNETNKVQDGNDPLVQIGQILNAHVSSMHWIETSVSQVASKIDEISKMYDSISRDNERSLRLAYNN